MKLLKDQEKICRELGKPDDLSASLGNQANILRARGDLDGAMELHKEEERICRELDKPDGLQRSLGNQAVILKDRGGRRARRKRR
jgi:nephrocystin-3